jgi:hypothetical protein
VNAESRVAELRARTLELLGAVENERVDAGALRQASARWCQALEALAAGPVPPVRGAHEIARLHALLRGTVEARRLGAGRALERVRDTRRSFREHVGRLSAGEICDVTG